MIWTTLMSRPETRKWRMLDYAFLRIIVNYINGNVSSLLLNFHLPEWIVFRAVLWYAAQYASNTLSTKASSSKVGWNLRPPSLQYIALLPTLLDVSHRFKRSGGDGRRLLILQLAKTIKKSIGLIKCKVEIYKMKWNLPFRFPLAFLAFVVVFADSAGGGNGGGRDWCWVWSGKGNRALFE